MKKKPKKGNPIALDLMTSKYKKRIVKPKKGKGSFKRKKNKYFITRHFCKKILFLFKFSGAVLPEMHPLNLNQIMLA